MNKLRIILKITSLLISSFLLLCFLVALTNKMILVSIIFLIILLFFIYLSMKILSKENVSAHMNKIKNLKQERIKNKEKILSYAKTVKEKTTDEKYFNKSSENDFEFTKDNNSLNATKFIEINRKINSDNKVPHSPIEEKESASFFDDLEINYINDNLKENPDIKNKEIINNAINLNNKDNLIKKTNLKEKRAIAKFNVAGVTKEDRQILFKEMVKEEKELLDKDELYDGYTNSEIKDFGGYYYEVDLYGYDYEISLVPEPNNEFDSKAIAVIHKDYGKLGYVPSEDCDRIQNILDKNNYELKWWLRGGKRKYFDEYEYKVRIQTLTYGMLIKLYKKGE